MSPTVNILHTLRDILDLLTCPCGDCLTDDCQLVPQPCRVVLSPGLNVAWDSCGASGDGECGCGGGKEGQLWANITTMETVPDAGNCERIIWTADVGIVRCAATLDDDGNPPEVEAEEHDAWQQAADADRIRYAIRCCESRSDAIRDVELVTWTALGPDGGCVGGAWTIRGILDECGCPVPEYPRERIC